MSLEEQLLKIEPADTYSMKQAKKRWDSIAKPLESLGKLEDVMIKIAGINRNAETISLEKSALVILCGDHGVVEEGVTQTGFEVTKLVFENFQKGETSAAVMAKEAGVDLFPIDMGIHCDNYENKELKPFVLIDRKIAKGTNNFTKKEAMSREQCERALMTGIEIVKELKEKGYQLIATGEMGIGNTTPSSALTSVLLSKEPEYVTGKGAGLSNQGLAKKIEVIKKGIRRYREETGTKEEQVPKGTEAIELLAQLGGYDIAGMTGVFLGGAVYGIPVLIDGFISSVSALTAAQIEPKVKGYLIASHCSKEPAGSLLMEALGADPFLDCNMCLGEGTGAVAVIPLIRMAAAVYGKMSTFQDISMEAYTYFEDSEEGEGVTVC